VKPGVLSPLRMTVVLGVLLAARLWAAWKEWRRTSALAG